MAACRLHSEFSKRPNGGVGSGSGGQLGGANAGGVPTGTMPTPIDSVGEFKVNTANQTAAMWNKYEPIGNDPACTQISSATKCDGVNEIGYITNIKVPHSSNAL